MGSVVALISLLLVMLSGLTAGLANQSTSAIASLETDTLAFSADDQQEASFTESQVTHQQLESWQQTHGVASAEPLGITQTRVEPQAGSSSATSAAVFGVELGGDLVPAAELKSGETLVSEEISDELAAGAGDTLLIGGVELTIAGLIENHWYSHTPVLWTSLKDWQRLAHVVDTDVVGTVISASHEQSADAEELRSRADAEAGTVSMSPGSSFSALSSYSSENGALTMIQALLYAVSALVIVAFFTVWTVQRTRDIAVLKALGASNRYVVGDALGQALVVLLAGSGAGGLAGWAGGVLASQAVPFVTSASTTALPAVGVVIIGLAGAAVAVRRVSTVDSLLALGGS